MKKHLLSSVKTGKVRSKSKNCDTALTLEEEQKFKLFDLALSKAIEQIGERDNFRANQGETFLVWIRKNIQKQKELVNAFSRVYKFLENKRQKHASEMTLEEYVMDAIEHGKNEFAENLHMRIKDFFIRLLFRISLKGSAEHMFSYLKTILLGKNKETAYITLKLLSTQD
ncbi:Mlp family lipoprotein [Borrelia miyamotoi]|uniref:Mlp family lipoprotein n=1 Tax=Borrelia miyamotoi TaxID=47466 RepID=A0AAQ2WY90_9SPIR|nr:Mlp family lipoprotein [Borrelia miyamotoi]AOW96292.1 hypothetical protein AXH25_04755 [Borrelia miyamotoi]QTL84174.1 Mlp family lipoprotein [Borrelia miyamotoi]WAZ85824.1 Mlp family lipoprotein [Borrelia miyamotoi]WAZ91606.1 Mlp family lipoprotein [Borrelia miyamotoi]WAZ92898.1 Mlp family lipoprotein [Borrelia miyamotoi]